MVGTAIKKYAKENNLTINNGVAYGEYKGILITLSDGYNIKTLSVYADLTSDELRTEITNMLVDKAFRKQYRINTVEVKDNHIDIVLLDTGKKTVKCITELSDLLADKLASRKHICACCSQSLEQTDTAVPVLFEGRACYMHGGCIESLNSTVSIKNDEQQQEGSVASGIIGAVIGGLLGSIPWGIAYYFGWFVGWLGFLIGFAAKKGYEIMHGKNTKAKGIVIILTTIICVVIAEFVTCLISIKIEFNTDPDLAVLPISTIIKYLFYFMKENSEFRGSVISDLLLGLLFAALGIGSTARDVFKQTSKDNGKAVRLDK